LNWCPKIEVENCRPTAELNPVGGWMVGVLPDLMDCLAQSKNMYVDIGQNEK
jgi:hypothetical protein